ncbi:MAG: 2-dehydropantoate 2-reductase [Chloroflexota bacterium]|jgi:2-dehydropantoate 2-reductase|nr:2-dehydropantoate 2-reductase [Chloroflexota bacterium]
MTDPAPLTATILGAGGLGSKFGARMAEAGADVWLIARNPHHAAAARNHGLTIVKGDTEQTVPIRASTDSFEPSPAEFIFVTVKTYDTEVAVRRLAPYLHEDALAITLQNGLGSIETMAEHFDEERCVLGVTFEGATLLDPGRVADMGSGTTYLAAGDATRERLARLAEALTAGGIETEVREQREVEGLLWGKLAMASGINPIATVLRVPNGALSEFEEACELSRQAIAETVAVAAAWGIELAFDPHERFEQTTRATRDMSSCTLLDAMRGRRTEIDAISGAIADEGDRLGVPTPLHRMLWRIIKAIEATAERRVHE